MEWKESDIVKLEMKKDHAECHQDKKNMTMTNLPHAYCTVQAQYSTVQYGTREYSRVPVPVEL